MIGSRFPALLAITIFGAGVLAAAPPTDPDRRAWQQRLEVEIPLPVPSVAVVPANPFASTLDTLPILTTFEPPRKLEVTGVAVVAAYVDSRGECLGAVPLQVPFPGLSGALTEGLVDTRFEPAIQNGQPRPSWPVVELRMEGKVKEAEVLAQNLALPDPSAPSEPIPPPGLRPSGQLVGQPYADPADLNALASPRNVRVRAGSNESEISIQALVHITTEGRCDRYVPLLMDSGLDRWLSGFLATWRLESATVNGEAIDCWMVYTGRIRIEMSSLSSGSYRILRDQVFTPESHP